MAKYADSGIHDSRLGLDLVLAWCVTCLYRVGVRESQECHKLPVTSHTSARVSHELHDR